MQVPVMKRSILIFDLDYLEELGTDYKTSGLFIAKVSGK